ncbi:hypothetical protein T45_01757 [Streptomyces turgidiscabies]|nr:hypothetical protein T45_01757 [Streptomyces turgidiscabies]
MPEGLVAHTGTPDVEDESEGIMRRPDVMLIAERGMEGQGAFDPRTLIAAIEVVSSSNPANDWLGKMRDYPLIGIPTYAIFDPRTGTGAVLDDPDDRPAALSRGVTPRQATSAPPPAPRRLTP